MGGRLILSRDKKVFSITERKKEGKKERKKERKKRLGD
jgi:hypothetical protein